MYGDNGTLMRRELAALLRQHRIQYRLGGENVADREEAGRTIRQYRQNVLIWCGLALQAARPLVFTSVPPRRTNPFATPGPTFNATGELARVLQRVTARSTATCASGELLTTRSELPTVEHWRQAARAAVFAEHDTAGELTERMTMPQAKALAGDVAAIVQALVILDERYQLTPGWEKLAQPTRLARAALATALDVACETPDYSIDSMGWRPRSKPITGPAQPGILGVLQAEHNLLVRLQFFPTSLSLRLIVDSQRLLSHKLAPFAARMDVRLGRQWEHRSETYGLIQRQLRDVGGLMGAGQMAAAEGASAVSRAQSIPPGTIIPPRVLGGFQVLFEKVDRRIADIVEEGFTRGALFERVPLPRVSTGTGQAVMPVRDRYRPVARPGDIPVVQTVRRELRPPIRVNRSSPGVSRVELQSEIARRSSNPPTARPVEPSTLGRQI